MNGTGAHPRILAIIQARMGSSRLPGKVLADIQGQPMLWRVIERVRVTTTVNDIVVATTTELADDVIASFCGEHGVNFFRGSGSDVLDRYYRTACRYEAQAIVRITSDCPLIDPEIIDQTVRAYSAAQPDYASNTVARTYPRGLDTEVLTFTALESAWSEARESYQRAHVTPYLYENPSRFRIVSVTGDKDYSSHRWTVDTEQDLEFVRAIYSRGQGKEFRLRDVLRMIEHEPHLSEINRSVVQKSLLEG